MKLISPSSEPHDDARTAVTDDEYVQALLATDDVGSVLFQIEKEHSRHVARSAGARNSSKDRTSLGFLPFREVSDEVTRSQIDDIFAMLHYSPISEAAASKPSRRGRNEFHYG